MCKRDYKHLTVVLALFLAFFIFLFLNSEIKYRNLLNNDWRSKLYTTCQ